MATDERGLQTTSDTLHAFDSPPLAITEAAETLAVSATGDWTAADVWVHASDDDWLRGVNVRLYARLGSARVLVAEQEIGAVEQLVLSCRGVAATCFEVALWTALADIEGVCAVHLRTWRHDLDRPFVSRALVQTTGADLSSLGDAAYARRLSSGRATYAATNTTPLSINTGTGSVAYLWHPSSVAEQYEIQRVAVAVGDSPNNSVCLRGARITAIHASPGGTNVTPLRLSDVDTASSAVFTALATNAPTRSTDDLFSWVADGRKDGPFVWEARPPGRGLVLPASAASGFEIRAQVTSTRSRPIQVTTTIHWVET